MIDGHKEIVKPKMRWLAAGTGLATLSCLAITTLYLPFPIMLIVGATIAGRWPRTGRWLMWISASVFSVGVLPVYVVLLLHPGGRFFDSDIWIMLGNFGWIGTVLLLPLCDAMLLLDAIKRRQGLRQIA